MFRYENISHLESDLKEPHGTFDSLHNKKILKPNKGHAVF